MEKNFSSIKQRVLAYINYKGITKRAFYLKTGISNSVLDKPTGLSEDGIAKCISTFPEIDPGWLLTGKGSMIKATSVGLPLVETIHGRSTIPFYDAGLAAGKAIINMGDLLGDSHAAMRVQDNSMAPGYPQGSVAGLREKTDSIIVPGQVYVIETDDNRYLKRLFLNNTDSEFVCVSDNDAMYETGKMTGQYQYPNFVIPKAVIKRLYEVTGVIIRYRNG